METLPVELIDYIILLIPFKYRVPFKFIKIFAHFPRVRKCPPNLKFLKFAAKIGNTELVAWLRELKYPMDAASGYLAKHKQWDTLERDCVTLTPQAFKYLLIEKKFDLYYAKFEHFRLRKSSVLVDRLIQELVQPQYMGSGYVELITAIRKSVLMRDD